MVGLIVFSVGGNRYALNIENIQRIIQAVPLTAIPNSHPLIEGMMSHEGQVIKVLSFRQLIGTPKYEDELSTLFVKLKGGQREWLDALKLSVDAGSKFTKTTNPHLCELGKWIDNFTSYDDKVSEVLSKLVEHHKQLHLSGGEACEIRKVDVSRAQQLVDVKINDIFNKTMGALDTFTDELHIVANSLQKLIIYEDGGDTFAIKVDTIEDIAHVDASSVLNSDEQQSVNEFLDLEGVLDLDSVLINVVKSVKIPK